MNIFAHQPGAVPTEIPEQIPNPAHPDNQPVEPSIPNPAHEPTQPARREKVPAK